MSEVVWLSLACLSGAYWVYQERQVRLARRAAAHACRDANVQWLDQAVFLKSRRLQWPQGSLRPVWVWSFEFEYSLDGLARQTGEIVMHSQHVQWVRLDHLILQDTLH